MLRKLAIFLAVLLLGGAGVYVYQQYILEEEPLSIGQLLPEDALWVYHSNRIATDWGQMQETPLGKLIETIPDVAPLSIRLQNLDSASLTTWLDSRSSYVVGQIIGNDDLGFTFYFELQSPEAKQWLQIEQDLLAANRWQSENRQYQGVTIYEWEYSAEKITFSWIRVENFIVGSFTPFLVEDQIRRLSSTQLPPNSWRLTFADNVLSQRDQGDLIVNADQLKNMFSVFAPTPQAGLTAAKLCQTMLLDISVEENQWLFSGFSELPSAQVIEPEQFFLSTFNEQSAQPFQLGNYLPNRTARVQEWAFTDAQDWTQRYTEFQLQLASDNEFERLQQEFSDQTGKSLAEWLSWAGNEFGIIEMESNGSNPGDKLILLEVSDIDALLSALQLLSHRSDSLSFQETFAGYSLQQFNNPVLLALLTGSSGREEGYYSECFYFHDSSYLVLSNRVNALKRLISDQMTESSWGKSAQQARFLENALEPANYSLIVDMPHYRETWVRSLSPKWSEWAQEQETIINQIGKIAIQFSALEDEYYTSMVVTNQAPTVASSGFSTTQRVRVDTLIGTKPFVVRNSSSQQLEVVVQDQANRVHLLNPTTQSVLWSDSIEAPIVSDIVSVTLSENKQQHYLYATDSVLYLTDRSGNPAPGYPLFLPSDTRVQYLSVFDYEQDGNYRFLLTDQSGKIWMYNVDRDNLPGWNPLSFTAPLSSAPQHFRVRGKDCIVALQENGFLYLLNRRGEPYPGFPVDLDVPCHNLVFVQVGNSFADTELITITDQGELLKLNLLGRLLQREQQFRTATATHFQLCPDRLEKTYILVRQDDQRLSVLDQRGQVWFEQSYFTPGALARGELAVQYYNFGSDNHIIAITDKIQEFTYLFNQRGRLINDRPVESANEVALLYSEANRQHRAYRVYEDELAVISF
ncbi:MAG: hypothetical protein AAF992_06175 [Bacteroidota bacterium]